MKIRYKAAITRPVLPTVGVRIGGKVKFTLYQAPQTKTELNRYKERIVFST